MSIINPLAIGRTVTSDMSPLERNQIAAEDFESYLVEMLLKEMRKTIPKGMLSSQAMDTFTEMMDKVMAQEIAASGGMGFADSMMKQMGVNLGDDGAKGGLLLENNPSLRKIGKGSGLLDHFKHAKDNIVQLVGKLPVQGRISSEFGMRHHPVHKEFRQHSGLDIAASKGSPIDAVMDGKVIFSGKRGTYGNTVVIQHDDGYKSLYAHCSELKVSVGDQVKSGAEIATVGSTGVTTGNHLHFEIRKNDEAVDPLRVFSWSTGE